MKNFTDLAIHLVAEAKIRQAYDEGEFDKLPGFGQPLPLDESGNFPCWAKTKMKREDIKLTEWQKKRG